MAADTVGLWTEPTGNLLRLISMFSAVTAISTTYFNNYSIALINNYDAASWLLNKALSRQI